MYTNRIPIYLIMSALLAISIIGLTIAATESKPNIDAVLELNDSTVNSNLVMYPFFILDFYELGCDPCEWMNAALLELAPELSGQVVFGRIDVEKNIMATKQYNITAYPTLLTFENGTLIEENVGFVSKEEIVNNLLRQRPDLNISNVTLVQVPAANAEAQVKVPKNYSDIERQDQPLMQAFIISY